MLRYRVLIFLAITIFMVALTPAGNGYAASTSVPLGGDKGDKSQIAEIMAVRWAHHVDAASGIENLRIVLDLTGPVTFKSEVSGRLIPQLIVNITGAIPGNINETYEIEGRVAEMLTIDAVASFSTRLILQLPLMIDASDYKVFTLPSDKSNNKPHRVVIDVKEKVPPVKYIFSAGLKNKSIVIDPGHGGSDSGAVGLNQTQEKTITLEIAYRLRGLLEKTGAKVIMTRSDDRDVFGKNASATDELNARTAIANNSKADAFISIHIDAFTNRIAGGTTTYYYQKTPYDALLAQSIQSFTGSASGLQDRGAVAANFYVIKNTVMPAVLAEIAFISNPAEERLIKTAEFQQKMAQGIFYGLDRFFTQAADLRGAK